MDNAAGQRRTHRVDAGLEELAEGCGVRGGGQATDLRVLTPAQQRMYKGGVDPCGVRGGVKASETDLPHRPHQDDVSTRARRRRGKEGAIAALPARQRLGHDRPRGRGPGGARPLDPTAPQAPNGVAAAAANGFPLTDWIVWHLLDGDADLVALRLLVSERIGGFYKARGLPFVCVVSLERARKAVLKSNAFNRAGLHLNLLLWCPEDHRPALHLHLVELGREVERERSRRLGRSRVLSFDLDMLTAKDRTRRRSYPLHCQVIYRLDYLAGKYIREDWADLSKHNLQEAPEAVPDPVFLSDDLEDLVIDLIASSQHGILAQAAAFLIIQIMHPR